MTEKQINWIFIVIILLVGGNISKIDGITDKTFHQIINITIYAIIILRFLSHLYAEKVIRKRKRIMIWLKTVTDEDWDNQVSPIHESLLRLSGEVVGGLITTAIMIILVIALKSFDFYYRAISIILCLGMIYLTIKFFLKALYVNRNCPM